MAKRKDRSKDKFNDKFKKSSKGPKGPKKSFSKDTSAGSRFKPQRPNRDEERGESGGARFEFRDRTGKVHGRGKKIETEPAMGFESRNWQSPERAAPRFEEPKRYGGKGRGRSEREGRPERDARGGRFERPSKKGGKFGGKFQDRGGREERGRRGERREYERAPRGRRGEELRLRATVDKNHKGFGFLIFADRSYEDAFIPPRDAQALFHGDRVEVVVSSRGEVEEINVLEHRFRELVGRFSPHPAGHHRGGWVVYERKRAREEIFVPEAPVDAKMGDWVKAKLEFHESGPFAVTAIVTEVYGPELPASADIGMVSAEYNLVEEHSEEAEKEARSMTLEVPGKDLEGRTDLREVPFITIDGETARDFDDAVYVERKKHGYILWVAIADVSHYVKDGTALDREARSRGTSVYFPERAFHMLPRALSENLCSLKPHEPRLSMVAKMECDREGKRVSTEVMEAVIQSHRRATYNQIQSEWEANQKNPEWEFTAHFELYQRIRKLRSDRGSIDFDLPEAELKVEPLGEVISITQRPRLEAHRLIEEFMIAANEAVTDWMMEKAWPFVYRIHEEPSQQALVKFQQLAAHVGVQFSLESAGQGVESPKIMAELVRRLEGHPAAALLNTALLRSLRQAIYSATHSIHYGLASPGYTHFTSPIRRYPDLVVHRLLRWALAVESRREKPLSEKEKADLEAELEEICEHCSYRERIASDAERESIKLKQVRAMTKELGNEFDGKIVGMIDSGMFVQIDSPYCEGMVSQESMNDDFYQFDEDRMIFVGRRKRKQYKMGDKVRIQVLKADIDKRQIDFGLIESQPVAPLTPGN